MKIYINQKSNIIRIATKRWNDFKTAVKVKMGLLSDTANTVTDTPKKDYLYQVKIIDDALNIRKAPGVNNPIVGVIKNRGVYSIIKETKIDKSTWGKLKSCAGWINISEKYAKKLEE